MSQAYLGDDDFHASIKGTTLGGLGVSTFALKDLKASTNRQTIKQIDNKSDSLFMSLVVSGSVHSEQSNRSIIDYEGDFSIRDTSVPWTIEHKGYSEVIAIELPRVRLENMLGPARRFAAVNINGGHPTATLARSFIYNLLSLEEQLTPQAADRMMTVAIDLIAASVADHMAMEQPKALHKTMMIQRAKAYVETNLGNLDLDPAQVAAAVGVSIRHLQAVFRDHGHSVSAWIWHRRLRTAARRLADPTWFHVQVGELAHRCGFADQAHFSRRFRSEYGATPREYRRAALFKNNAS
jgi:AraC-like DNA-binding protein